MVDVVTSIVIGRPAEEVSVFAADPENAPKWYKNIYSAAWKTDPPVRQGALFAFKARFLGRELAYTYRVEQWEPGRIMVMSTAEGPFPMKTIYTWEPAGPGAVKMTLRNTGSPKGFSKIFAPFMASAMKKANEKDLQLLKQILEAAQ